MQFRIATDDGESPHGPRARTRRAREESCANHAAANSALASIIADMNGRSRAADAGVAADALAMRVGSAIVCPLLCRPTPCGEEVNDVMRKGHFYGKATAVLI